MAVTTSRTPASIWGVFQLFLPLVPLLVGIVAILFVQSAQQKVWFDLFKGVVIGLLAVSLLANVVCSFFSSSPPPVSEQQRNILWGVFIFVLVVAAACVMMESVGEITNKVTYILFQCGLAIIASVFSWRARS